MLRDFELRGWMDRNLRVDNQLGWCIIKPRLDSSLPSRIGPQTAFFFWARVVNPAPFLILDLPW